MPCKWNLNGVDFVTLLKSNATYESRGELMQYPGNVQGNEVIYFRGFREKYPERFAIRRLPAMWRITKADSADK